MHFSPVLLTSAADTEAQEGPAGRSKILYKHREIVLFLAAASVFQNRRKTSKMVEYDAGWCRSW
jgi:hypothetical protein